MSRQKHILILVSVTLAIAAMLMYASYVRLGRTPAELLAYCERRLEGHPKLETVLVPLIRWVRQHVR